MKATPPPTTTDRAEATDQLSDQEWNELQGLRLAISERISSVHPARQERFTQLFVRSLRGKGDPPRK